MNPHSKEITDHLITMLNEAIIPCSIRENKFCETLSNLIGDARIVLMGEATHGTEEFYQARRALTEYLIQTKGFQAIAIEGDWTSVYPMHCFLQGNTQTKGAKDSLKAFERFPKWMWRNQTVIEMLNKLHEYNDKMIEPENKIGFYGLDLYCINEAMDAVIEYLKIYQPNAVNKAIEYYGCFDHARVDPQLYSYLTEEHLKQACIKQVTEQLLELQRLAYININHNAAETEQLFYAIQNARLVKNAENYYRALFEPHYITWNIRDSHMVDTLQNIMTHLETNTMRPAKIIIWAHNSHVGDARATEMSEQQEINLGQLVRERFNNTSFSLGFSTSEGTAMAASEWDGEGQEKKLNSPVHGSYEWFFHSLKVKDFILNLHDETPLTHLLKTPLLQRAIGVIYRPESERLSHYFFSRLPYQFDAMVHIDHTSALKILP